VAVLNGLARYDGYAFKRFYFNSTIPIPVRPVIGGMSKIAQGKYGWREPYLDVYNPIDQKFRQYKFTDQLSNQGVLGDVGYMRRHNGRMYFDWIHQTGLYLPNVI
jgi:hypothetical protein